MKQTYQLLIHGHGFNASLGDESARIGGFYTARRIKASSRDDALRLGLESFRSEEKTRSLMEESVTNGASPQFEVDELFLVPIWKTLFHRFRPGFIFYEMECDSQTGQGLSVNE